MTAPASLRRRCLAEAVGTAVLVGIGTGTIVAGAARGGLPIADVAVAWFLAVALPIQAFAYVSGAHLNPGVTLGLVAARRFPPRDAVAFVGAQILGAFAGSLAVWGALGNGAHLGTTAPGPAGPLWIFPLEFLFTFLLVGTVLYLVGLGRAPNRWELLLPAAVVGVSTYAIGPWTGSSLNPARSVAPAVLSGDLAWLWLYLATVVVASAVAAVVVEALRGPAPRPTAAAPDPE